MSLCYGSHVTVARFLESGKECPCIVQEMRERGREREKGREDRGR
jgi:hypothetical protein